MNVALTQNVAWLVATVLSTIAMLMRAGILGLPLGSAFGPTIMLRALAAERWSAVLTGRSRP